MLILLISAFGVGFIHTLFGHDHYVPFVVLAKARGWSIWRTASITLISWGLIPRCLQRIIRVR